MNLIDQDTLTFLQNEIKQPIHAALILGSGLNPLVQKLDPEYSRPYSEIPGLPVPSVPGHRGVLHVAEVSGVRLAVFEGRFHAYEGLSLKAVTVPVQVAQALGAKTLIVTNAAGGIHAALRTGGFMLVRDHLNLMGYSPLVGSQLFKGLSRFPDMSGAYSETLRLMARGVFEKLKIRSFEGVLAAVTGPCYETPSEVQMLKNLGADAVCMSTVPEVIMARALQMDVLGISLVTNRAAGMGSRPLKHSEVIKVGEANMGLFTVLMQSILSGLGDLLLK